MINDFVTSISISYSEKEKALPLGDSKGTDKSRIHLFDFYGEHGTDRFAIAAEILHNKTPAKLGFIDKKIYIIAEIDGTTYKINKNSLCKRLGISKEELKQHTKGGIAKDDFNGFIKTKLNECIKNDFRNHASALAINNLGTSPPEFKQAFNKLPEIEKNAMAKYLAETAYDDNKLEVLTRILQGCNDRGISDLFEPYMINCNAKVALGKLELSTVDFEDFISKFPIAKQNALVGNLVASLTKDHLHLALQKTLTELESKKSPLSAVFNQHYNAYVTKEAAKNNLSIEEQKTRRNEEMESHLAEWGKSPAALKELFTNIPQHEFPVAANSIIEFLYLKDPGTLKKSIEEIGKTNKLLGLRLQNVYGQTEINEKRIAEQRANESAIVIQNIMRGVIAKRALETERKHQLSSELIGRVQPLLTDENLNAMPHASQGAKAKNIKMPKQLPIVIRVEGKDFQGTSTEGNNKLRIGTMREARKIIIDNDYKDLVVPKARMQGPFLIEDRLPAVGGHYATMAYYQANHKDLDQAAVEFVSFLMKTDLGDIVGGDGGYMKNLWEYGRPRYDNVLVYPEIVDGKKVGKIGLIDLDQFSPSPSWRGVSGAAENAITLFPYQYDLILAKCRERHKFTAVEMNRLEKCRDVALNALEQTVGKHRAFVETHELSDKPFKITLSDEDQEELKNKMRFKFDQNLESHMGIISNRTKLSPEEVQKIYDEKISQSVDKEFSDMVLFLEKEINSKREKAKKFNDASIEQQLSARIINKNLFGDYENTLELNNNERENFFNDSLNWIIDELILSQSLDSLVEKLVEKNLIANVLHPNDEYRLLYV